MRSCPRGHFSVPSLVPPTAAPRRPPCGALGAQVWPGGQPFPGATAQTGWKQPRPRQGWGGATWRRPSRGSSLRHGAAAGPPLCVCGAGGGVGAGVGSGVGGGRGSLGDPQTLASTSPGDAAGAHLGQGRRQKGPPWGAGTRGARLTPTIPRWPSSECRCAWDAGRWQGGHAPGRMVAAEPGSPRVPPTTSRGLRAAPLCPLPGQAGQLWRLCVPRGGQAGTRPVVLGWGRAPAGAPPPVLRSPPPPRGLGARGLLPLPGAAPRCQAGRDSRAKAPPRAWLGLQTPVSSRGSQGSAGQVQARPASLANGDEGGHWCPGQGAGSGLPHVGGVKRRAPEAAVATGRGPAAGRVGSPPPGKPSLPAGTGGTWGVPCPGSSTWPVGPEGRPRGAPLGQSRHTPVRPWGRRSPAGRGGRGPPFRPAPRGGR